MKKLFLALAFIGALTAPALAQTACGDVNYQYDYSKQIILDIRDSEGVVETYIIEGVDKVDAFLVDFNAKTGNDVPLGVTENLLGIVFGNPETGYTLKIFGYTAGCQIGWIEAPWEV